MSKRDLLLIVTSIAFVLSCTDNTKQSDIAGKNQNVVTTGEEESDILDEERSVDVQDPLEVVWDSFSSGSLLSGLSFTVTNNSEEEINYRVETRSDSVIGLATKIIGTYSLEAGGATTMTVNASDFPVRSSVVYSAGMVRVVRSKTLWTGDEVEEPSRTKALYYKHDSEYENLVAYSFDSISEIDGNLLTIENPDKEETFDLVLGAMINEEGQYSEIMLRDSELAVKDEDNNLVGITGKVNIGVEDMTEIEEEVIQVYEDEEDNVEEELLEE